uniref:Uncharacterized protein n=1 Tax=Acrobeloides nanus TaxID=290746 RepID=A0A914DGR1_9BILA
MGCGTSSAGVNPADDAGPNEGPPPDAGVTNNANKPPEEHNSNKNLKPPEDTGGDNTQDHQAHAQHHDASHQNVVSGGGIETANNQTVTSNDAGGGGASGDTGGGGASGNTGGGGGVSHD